MTHSYAYINKSTALGKARELLTTSGGAPKPEPELWVRVAKQQALALGDLAGSIISMWIVEVLGANPHQLGVRASWSSPRGSPSSWQCC